MPGRLIHPAKPHDPESYKKAGADLGYAESTIPAMLGHAAESVTSRDVHNIDDVLSAAFAKTISDMTIDTKWSLEA
jgi:hypothetical protein